MTIPNVLTSRNGNIMNKRGTVKKKTRRGFHETLETLNSNGSTRQRERQATPLNNTQEPHSSEQHNNRYQEETRGPQHDPQPRSASGHLQGGANTPTPDVGATRDATAAACGNGTDPRSLQNVHGITTVPFNELPSGSSYAGSPSTDILYWMRECRNWEAKMQEAEINYSCVTHGMRKQIKDLCAEINTLKEGHGCKCLRNKQGTRLQSPDHAAPGNQTVSYDSAPAVTPHNTEEIESDSAEVRAEVHELSSEPKGATNSPRPSSSAREENDGEASSELEGGITSPRPSSFGAGIEVDYEPSSELLEPNTNHQPSAPAHKETEYEANSELQEDFPSSRPPTPPQDEAEPTAEAQDQGTIPPGQIFNIENFSGNFYFQQSSPHLVPRATAKAKPSMKVKQQTAVYRKKRKNHRSTEGRRPTHKL